MASTTDTLNRSATRGPAAKSDARDRFVAFAFAGADVLIETDAAGMVVFAAGALGLFGRSADDMTGRPLLDFCAAADRTVVRDLLERPERITRRNAHMLTLRDPDGAAARFELTCGVFPEFGEHFFFSLCHADTPDRGDGQDLAAVADVAQGDRFAAIAAERFTHQRAAGRQDEN